MNSPCASVSERLHTVLHLPYDSLLAIVFAYDWYIQLFNKLPGYVNWLTFTSSSAWPNNNNIHIGVYSIMPPRNVATALKCCRNRRACRPYMKCPRALAVFCISFKCRYPVRQQPLSRHDVFPMQCGGLLQAYQRPLST